MKFSRNDLKEMKRIIDKLEDSESKEIYTYRALYSITGDKRYIYDMMGELAKREEKEILRRYTEIQRRYQLYDNSDLYSFLLKNLPNSDGNIVIFGAGNCGKEVLYWLRSIGFSPDFFCDNDNKKCGSLIEDCLVISSKTLEEKHSNSIVIIASYDYHSEIRKQLSQSSISQKLIYEYEINGLASSLGTSYFESGIFQPSDNEIFVDAGAYRGETTEEFIEWCPAYKKIYCFEPDKVNFEQLRNNVTKTGIRDIEVYNAGLWSKNDVLCFEKHGDASSHIKAKGEEKINAVSLDSLLNGEKVTFIKMDIEGAEKEALDGAKNTIKKYAPKLAICIYHKPEDIVELPRYISQLVPEYRFKIRHYSTYLWETVLYAYL